MSAWIVSPEHIDLILTEMKGSGLIDASENLDEIGQMLLDENRASVDYRYNKTNERIEYTFVEFSPEYNRHDVDMAMQSYQYQSCEHPEWDGSLADVLIDQWIYENNQRYDVADILAAQDDDNRGWSVGVEYIWDRENETRLPDYRARDATMTNDEPESIDALLNRIHRYCQIWNLDSSGPPQDQEWRAKIAWPRWAVDEDVPLDDEGEPDSRWNTQDGIGTTRDDAIRGAAEKALAVRTTVSSISGRSFLRCGRSRRIARLLTRIRSRRRVQRE